MCGCVTGDYERHYIIPLHAAIFKVDDAAELVANSGKIRVTK